MPQSGEVPTRVLGDDHSPPVVDMPTAELFYQRLAKSRFRGGSTANIALHFFGLFSVVAHPDRGMWWVGFATISTLLLLQFCLRRLTKRDRDFDRQRYDTLMFMSFALCPVLMYFYGPYTPFSGLVVLLLFQISIGASRFVVLANHLVVAIPHLVLGGLILSGLVQDRGMIKVNGGFLPHLIALGTVASLYTLTYVMSRVFRDRAYKTFKELHAASRRAAEREALLSEARADLVKVAGIGQPGRFTNHQMGGYVLGTVLGRGGMGVIYNAVHQDDGTRVAVKILLPPRDDAATYVQRFKREARIVSQLVSKHIVRLIKYGGLESVSPFFVMEFLDGKDLGELLRDHVQLEPEEVVIMVKQAALALQEAAKIDVVHRDIKPANLFRCHDGTWKVLDFGIASVAASDHTLTGAQLIGTPSYMAPEQLSDGDLSSATDQHALAVVAYRALTGSQAFGGGEVAQIFQRVIGTLPFRPSIVGHPLAVDDVMRVAMAKDPEQRFSDVVEFADALEQALIMVKVSAKIRTAAKELNKEGPTWE